MRLLSLLLIFFMSVSTVSFAVEPDEVLENVELEQRAREISKGIRCLVCQNENIDESNSELAKTLRLVVRDRLVQGDTDEEVVDFIVDRFGEYALLTPKMSLQNIALYLAPLIFLILGALAVFGYVRKSKAVEGGSASSEFSSDEMDKIKEFLNK